MAVLSANQAKTQFGDLLMQAQREPVTISKNGKAVAVVISMEEYESNEALKLEALKARAAKAKSDIAASNTIDGESFFDALEAGQHD
jgi:prevent-host-death family protein